MFFFTSHPIKAADQSLVSSSEMKPSHSHSLKSTARIVTLSPNLAELAISAGLETNLVAVSAYSDYPSWLAKLPVISDSQGVFIESLLAIRPDKVIAQEHIIPAHTQLKLKQLGLEVVELSMGSINDLSVAITFLSTFAKEASIGKKTIDEINTNVQAIEKTFELNKKEFRAFIQFSTHPLLTNNGQTILSELLTKCGITNIFADEKNVWPIVNQESVMQAFPNLLLVIQNDNKVRDSESAFFVVSDNDVKKEYLTLFGHDNPMFANIPLIILDPDVFSRETPRVIHHTRLLCEYLQTEKNGF